MARLRHGFPLLVLGLCFGGCAAGNIMDSGLSRLIGKDVRDAISQLGAYDGQPLVIDGDKTFTWTASHDVLVPIASTQATGALVGGRQITATSTTGYTEQRQQCQIRLTTDPANRIKSYNWAGDGCVLFYGRTFRE